MLALQPRMPVKAAPKAATRAMLRAPSRSAHLQRRRAVVPPRAVMGTHTGMSLASFEELVQQAPTPAVLVDFYTTWCGPCKVLDQNIKAIQKAHQGSVTFIKVDTEANTEVADHFAVQKLPTLVLFKQGQQVDRYEGLLSGQDLDMRLRKFLK